MIGNRNGTFSLKVNVSIADQDTKHQNVLNQRQHTEENKTKRIYHASYVDKNHYASQCPMRRNKVEQANVFVGMMNMINKDKFMEEQIKLLTELEKVPLVNRILRNMGANGLFEPKGQVIQGYWKQRTVY